MTINTFLEEIVFVIRLLGMSKPHPALQQELKILGFQAHHIL